MRIFADVQYCIHADKGVGGSEKVNFAEII
jgi:hypothetical protein